MRNRMNAEQIARVAHEVNRAYCTATGDDSQVAWEDAPANIRASAIDGVGAHLRESLTPEQSHERWCAFKVADGWIYGPEKSAEMKQHPCLVPYANLPQEQRVKDYLFAAVVASLR